MESPIATVKTEVEEAEKEEFSTNWINTNQSCLFCLQYSDEVKVIHLRSLLGHLQINEQEVYPDNDGNSRPVRNGEWDDILVDLCKSCAASHFRLYTLVEQLQEIQMEIDNILEETNKSIFESGRNRKLEENFFAKLGSNPRTPFNSQFVDNLRKRIAEKCKFMLFGQQLESTLEGGIHEAFAGNESGSLGDAESSSKRMEILNKTGTSVAQGNEEADFAPTEENSSSGIAATVVEETESESSAASTLTAKRVGDVVTSKEDDAEADAARTVSTPEPETEDFSGPSLPSEREEFQASNHSSEDLEEITRMETCEDEVVIDSGRQKDCFVCRAEVPVPAGGPNGDDLKTLVIDFGELVFDNKTLDGLENCGNAGLNGCKVCIQMLEEAKGGTEKMIVLERMVKDINGRLIKKLSELKLTAEKTASTLKKISNSMGAVGAEAMTTDKATGNKTASDHFGRGVLKSTENLSKYQKALNRGMLVLDCFKPDSLNLSNTLKTATPGPSGMIPFVLLTAEEATAQENHAGTAASVESDSESESIIAPSSKKRKKRNVFRESEEASQDEESSQNEATSIFASKTPSSNENEMEESDDVPSPSSSHRMQMLNTNVISVAEKEPLAHSSSHSAASYEPGRSLRRRKQEALQEKESPSAISSGQKTKDKVAPSTSKCREAQPCEGTGWSKYHTKNSTTGLFHCRKCDKQSPCENTIRLHYKSFHLKIRHHCDICHVAVFTSRFFLTKHRLTCQQNLEKRQAKEKDPKFNFVCEICGRRFDSQKVLCEHRLVVHKNVDRYPCDLCDKKFKTSHNLKVHKDGVHFGKKISCKFCKKLYGPSSGSRSALKKHENSCKAKTVEGLAKQA